MSSVLKDRATPGNPLGIIALFVFFIEAIATVSLGLAAKTAYVGHLVVFIIAYPTFIALAFFVVLWFKREAFYTPSDFRDDTTFKDLLRRVQVIDAKQDAAILGPSVDLNDVFRTIDRLITLDDVYAAVNVGRAYLKEDHYQTGLKVFEYLATKIDRAHELYYKVLANRAYARIGAERYGEAIRDLEEVRGLDKGRFFRAWHAIALAYAHFKQDDQIGYKKWLAIGQKAAGYAESRAFLCRIYPEIHDDLH